MLQFGVHVIYKYILCCTARKTFDINL